MWSKSRLIRRGHRAQPRSEKGRAEALPLFTRLPLSAPLDVEPHASAQPSQPATHQSPTEEMRACPVDHQTSEPRRNRIDQARRPTGASSSQCRTEGRSARSRLSVSEDWERSFCSSRQEVECAFAQPPAGQCVVKGWWGSRRGVQSARRAIGVRPSLRQRIAGDELSRRAISDAEFASLWNATLDRKTPLPPAPESTP